MNWFRNSRLSLFLSFWMLWSTAGIKLYLEYCSCAEDLKLSIFESHDNKCSDHEVAALIGDQQSGEEDDHNCCKSTMDTPTCPPEGCDSQDVQEYKVQSPFIPSASDELNADLPPFLATGLLASLQVDGDIFREKINNEWPDHLYRSALQYRIYLQSFLC